MITELILQSQEYAVLGDPCRGE